jgi:hypothetical protein
MQAIVTHLTLGKPLDDAILRKIEADLGARARANADFVELRIVRVSDTEAISLAFFRTREALDDFSSKVAGPWFAENVRPYLGGPVQRSVGEVIATIAR